MRWEPWQGSEHRRTVPDLGFNGIPPNAVHRTEQEWRWKPVKMSRVYNSEKWEYYGYILKMEPTGFGGELDVRCVINSSLPFPSWPSARATSSYMLPLPRLSPLTQSPCLFSPYTPNPHMKGQSYFSFQVWQEGQQAFPMSLSCPFSFFEIPHHLLHLET